MDSFTDFQMAAARTINPEISPKERKANFAMGLAGEAGEVIEPMKKELFHGKDIDLEKLTLEIGDVLWYLAGIATEYNISLDRAAELNIQKLKERHPHKFTGGYHGGLGVTITG